VAGRQCRGEIGTQIDDCGRRQSCAVTGREDLVQGATSGIWHEENDPVACDLDVVDGQQLGVGEVLQRRRDAT
jgi:hypothetical protein